MGRELCRCCWHLCSRLRSIPMFAISTLLRPVTFSVFLFCFLHQPGRRSRRLLNLTPYRSGQQWVVRHTEGKGRGKGKGPAKEEDGPMAAGEMSSRPGLARRGRDSLSHPGRPLRRYWPFDAMIPAPTNRGEWFEMQELMFHPCDIPVTNAGAISFQLRRGFFKIAQSRTFHSCPCHVLQLFHHRGADSIKSASVSNLKVTFLLSEGGSNELREEKRAEDVVTEPRLCLPTTFLPRYRQNQGSSCPIHRHSFQTHVRNIWQP